MRKISVYVASGLFLGLALSFLSSAQAGAKKDVKAKTVDIQAKVHYIGNSYSRLPDGNIIGTLRFYEYEGCYVMLKDRKVHLAFQPPMELVDQQSLGGRTLILSGTWNNDAFMVTGYREPPAKK